MSKIEWTSRVALGGYCAVAVLLSDQSPAAELPTPCIAGSCGANAPSVWVTAGNASAVYQGNSLTVTQTTQNAILNWQNFNISADGTVEFKQPDATSVALNRIFQADPSRIFGALNANGRVYLVNRNGIIFGEGARVNVAALVASTLDVHPDVVERGLVAGAQDTPAFRQFTDADGNALASQQLEVREGARLFADGGQVFLFAPVIENQGRIETPDGQTILAAGQSVYLSQSAAGSDLRGIVVAVDVGGTVDNGSRERNGSVTDPNQLVGQILAERGNVTLAGLAVNQNGRVSATTSVRANGSVRLVAAQRGAGGGGTLTLGRGSLTDVTLDHAPNESTVDVNAQRVGSVLLAGNRVNLESRSSVVVPGGNVRIKASNEGAESVNNDPLEYTGSDSRIFMDRDARIDVSGAHVDLAMERNLLEVELRGSQLADSPNQRNGALRGQRVRVDMRDTGKREDGSTWYGSPLADLSGDLATVARTVEERHLTGGTVELRSQGDIVLAGGARVNVSGGSARYSDGYLNTSALRGADGRIYDISQADPNLDYVSVLGTSSYERRHARWGVTEQFVGTFGGGRGRYESGYVEGKDAGTLDLIAPRVVFDGDLIAKRTIGEHQRLPSSTVPSGSLYRPFDQIPVGGELLLGVIEGAANQFVVTDVRIESGSILSGLQLADGTQFDPLTHALPETVSAVRLRPELLGEAAATRLTVRSDGSVTLPAQTTLDLPAFSSVNITARNIDVAGTISSAGGSVNLQARRTTTQNEFGQGELRLREGARIDLSGVWVNETTGVAPARPIDALAINGGRATLTGTDSDVRLDAGSSIDVSGGARLRRDGSVVAGTGGAISISAASTAGFADRSPLLEMNSQLSAYALFRGGSLALSAGEVCIGAALASCGESVSDEALLLTPEQLASGGFSSYTVRSNRRGLAVGDDTEIVLQARNLQLEESALQAPSARSLRGLAAVTTLDPDLRRPVSLTLGSSYLQTAPLSAADFPVDSLLSVRQGARILAEPGADISLLSNTSIAVDGAISAPAGTISLTLDNSLVLADDLPGYAPSQSVWLGANARLSAAGTVRYRPNTLGILEGDVLAGGTISIEAQRGYIAANPGSVLDVSGSTGEMDIRVSGLNGVERYERRNVGSAGGTMRFTAAESIFLGGELRAASGNPSEIIGGSLHFTLDAQNRYGSNNGRPALFPEQARSVELAQTATPTVFAQGAALDESMAGSATLAADLVESAGFDHVRIAARSRAHDTLGVTTGEVVLADGVDLSVRGSVAIDSAAIASAGGAARIAAPVISLGQSSTVLQNVPATLEPGTGTVEFSAGLIDLIGHTALSGFSDVNLRASGDIRARGVQLGSARTLEGSLRTTGALTLEARQIYPSTLSQFAFVADQPGLGSIRVEAAGGAAGPVYSAGGSLTLRAPSIEQGGVLRAPFGTITLAADDLRLLSSSVTSTSAAGAAVPFGQTQGGFDWVYSLGNQTLVYGPGKLPLPSQSVRLEGRDVEVQEGATLDLRGGGDLLATEFVPGVGGTRDILSASTRPDAFAIVPASSLQYAPHDVGMYDGSTITAGQGIHLDGGAGIPAGDYVVLPARYALLPGAYYVRPVEGYQDIGPNDVNRLPDGSRLVSGYRTFAGLRADQRTSGYSVRPGSEVLREAQYDVTSANGFFPTRAQQAESALARIPRDAGTLSIMAGASLTLDGDLLGTAAQGGRGTALDISSDSLRVVANADAAAQEGVVNLDARALSSFGAASILLGGTRAETKDGTAITTRSRSVSVESGASIAGPEVMLAASESVSVENAAEIRGEGTFTGQTDDITLSGDGAFLRVSSGPDATVARTGTTSGTAQLRIENGASLRAPGGAVAAESSGTAKFAPMLDLDGGVLALIGDRISLGNVADVTTGVALTNEQLASLSLDSLILSSRTTLDLYGPVNLATGDLTLRGGALRGFGSDTATLAATGTLALEGAATSDPNAGAGSGRLSLQGEALELREGSLAISGFSGVTMSAARQIEVQGNGALTVTGDLSMSGAALAAQSGSRRDIDVSGAFAYRAGGAAVTEPAEAELGARLEITAGSVVFDGRADLHSGVLALYATGGDVVFGESADVRMNGVASRFDGVTVGSRGGWLAAESATGNVRIDAGAGIDVRSVSAASSDRGSVSLRAVQGTVDARGDLSGSGADFSVDANNVADFGGLNARLNAGQFTGDRYVRQRGAGDLVVDSASSAGIDARSVQLIADQGRVVVDGVIRSHADVGGRITLASRDGVSVRGTLDASASTATERNGRIELQTTAGAIEIASGARINALNANGRDKNAADGTLHIRAPRTLLATLTDVDRSNDGLVLGANLSGVKGISIEGYASYADADGRITADETTAMPGTLMYDEAVAFAAQRDAILAGLGLSGGPAPQLLAGIEITAEGDLTLADSWWLNEWRFNDLPGVLTLRAGGNVTVDALLSDGFLTDSPFSQDEFGPTTSWSYRVSAGADLTSADPLAVRQAAELAAGQGSLLITGGRGPSRPTQNPTFHGLRTGTGSIDIAAARNVELANSYSVIYTSGLRTEGTSFAGRLGELGGRMYPDRGGDIRITAGADVVGAPTDQLITDWLYRIGRSHTNPENSFAPAWTVNFQNFRQNIGTLGGGDIQLRAGRDVRDLSLVAPSIGRQQGQTLAQSDLEIIAGGNIDLRAGGSVIGGTVYAGLGRADVVAGDAIAVSEVQNRGLVLALGDAQAHLSARSGLQLASMLNPTLLGQGRSQTGAASSRSYFSTYTENTSLSLVTASGELSLLNDRSAIAQSAPTLLLGPEIEFEAALTLYAPEVQAAALRGDATIQGSFGLYPAHDGGLTLLAHQDVLFQSEGGVQVIVSDANPAQLPSLAVPLNTDASLKAAFRGGQRATPSDVFDLPFFNAAVPERLRGMRTDFTPSRIVATHGDVRMTSLNDGIYFAEPARIVAGRDVSRLSMRVQNLQERDISSVIAGRDIVYPLTRSANGSIVRDLSDILVDGPGALELRAGRHVNLQTSGGVRSMGNIQNPALPDSGADISIEVGTAARAPNLAGFVDRYLVSAEFVKDHPEDAASYRQQLVDYMQMRGSGAQTYEGALSEFRALGASEQAPLLQRILFAELRESGRAAAEQGTENKDYTRGFAALTTYYPGANPDLEAGEKNPYVGDMRLYFSGVYTLKNGDIRLLAPGGEINAGLASPPATFNLNKQPAELGVVAQRDGSVSALSFYDFLVNESRVFAADGGDILVWATQGDIDAGRGAKSAISAPPPTVSFDPVTGAPIVEFPPALTGSGIRAMASTEGRKEGNVYLFAPRGVVNAGDAGIAAGNLTISATAVLGADNIQVSGVAVGVPVDTGGLGASLSGVSSVASSASSAASMAVDTGEGEKSQTASLAETALSWLEVFVVGLGDDACSPQDVDCMKRQSTTN